MKDEDLNHLDYLKKIYNSQKRILEFRATSLEEWKKWKSALTEKFLELLGEFPDPSYSFDVKVIEHVKEKGYTREKIYYLSEKDVYVPAYILIPSDADPPFRCVIALHGHGRGVADVIGSGTEEEIERYVRPMNYDYAVQLVKHGFFVFAPEMRGFGERRDEQDRIKGPGVSSCRQMSYNSVMLGRHILAYRIFDIIKGIDYLTTRSDVNSERIGCLGLSHGGTLTALASIFDERIKVSVISGYVNTFKDSIMAMPHCDCNYIPGILKYAELYDLISLIAPRPLFVEHGLKDPIFPLDAAKFAFEKIKRVYDLTGKPQNLKMSIFDGGHQFNGEGAFEWLERFL